jgi:hypothetical protein
VAAADDNHVEGCEGRAHARSSILRLQKLKDGF